MSNNGQLHITLIKSELTRLQNLVDEIAQKRADASIRCAKVEDDPELERFIKGKMVAYSDCKHRLQKTLNDAIEHLDAWAES